MKRMLFAALAACGATSALAVPALERVEVRPNPARFAGTTPPQVEIVVTVKRGPLDTQRCEIMIDPGNPGGRQVPRLVFNMGSERTQTARYVYDKPGSYRVTVRGYSNCSGSRTVTVEVRGAEGEKAAGPAKAAGKPRCPGGWTLVESSVQGARFACSPRLPASPMKCESGTSYYAENGIIGCR